MKWGAGCRMQEARGKTQIVPVWDSASRAPWDGMRLVVKLDDLAEFCRRERVTVNLEKWNRWTDGKTPEYTMVAGLKAQVAAVAE